MLHLITCHGRTMPPLVELLLILTFSKKIFRNTIRVSNSLDPDQALRFVGPDLGPNCLQRLSAVVTDGEELILHSVS